MIRFRRKLKWPHSWNSHSTLPRQRKPKILIGPFLYLNITTTLILQGTLDLMFRLSAKLEHSDKLAHSYLLIISEIKTGTKPGANVDKLDSGSDHVVWVFILLQTTWLVAKTRSQTPQRHRSHRRTMHSTQTSRLYLFHLEIYSGTSSIIQKWSSILYTDCILYTRPLYCIQTFESFSVVILPIASLQAKQTKRSLWFWRKTISRKTFTLSEYSKNSSTVSKCSKSSCPAFSPGMSSIV